MILIKYIISYFFPKLGKMSQNLSSAAIGALSEDKSKEDEFHLNLFLSLK